VKANMSKEFGGGCAPLDFQRRHMLPTNHIGSSRAEHLEERDRAGSLRLWSQELKATDNEYILPTHNQGRKSQEHKVDLAI
jgi:hypothetical protein